MFFNSCLKPLNRNEPAQQEAILSQTQTQAYMTSSFLANAVDLPISKQEISAMYQILIAKIEMA